MKIRTTSNNMRNLYLSALLALVLPASASAALIATSTDASGNTSYAGLGETSPGSGIGTGMFTLGNCSFDGTTTSCFSAGTYVEDFSSSNDPGGTGTYVFTLTYSGEVSPLIAQSIDPGSDTVAFSALGDALFTLEVTPDAGGMFTGVFPADPFEDSIGFSFSGANLMCTGLPGGEVCGIGSVGLNAGAVVTADIDVFQFSIPDSVIAPIPLPPAFILMLTGLMVIGRMKRRLDG